MIVRPAVSAGFAGGPAPRLRRAARRPRRRPSGEDSGHGSPSGAGGAAPDSSGRSTRHAFTSVYQRPLDSRLWRSMCAVIVSPSVIPNLPMLSPHCTTHTCYRAAVEDRAQAEQASRSATSSSRLLSDGVVPLPSFIERSTCVGPGEASNGCKRAEAGCRLREARSAEEGQEFGDAPPGCVDGRWRRGRGDPATRRARAGARVGAGARPLTSYRPEIRQDQADCLARSRA